MVIVNVIVIVSLGIHAVVCVYIITGVGRLDVAYPYLGAMREPDDRDRRERDILPRLFCFHKFFAIVDRHGEVAGQHTLCVSICRTIRRNKKEI